MARKRRPGREQVAICHRCGREIYDIQTRVPKYCRECAYDIKIEQQKARRRASRN